MRQISFLGTVFATLALWGFLTGPVAAYPTWQAPVKPSGATAVSNWERMAEAKPAKPADPKPGKEEPGLLTKALNKLIGNDKDPPAEKDTKKKSAKSSKTKTAKTARQKPEKEEPGLLTKTLKLLVGGDDANKADASKVKLEKSSGKATEKEEPGLLTQTLKKLVGGDGDKKKDPEKAKQNLLNPLNIAPTVSATQKQKEDKPQVKTAKTETKATLKDSFKKLIGVDAAKDKAKALDTVVNSAKQEESGVTAALKKILGGGDKKDPPAGKAQPAETQQAKKKSGTTKQAQAKTSEEPAVKRTSGQTRKYLGQQSEANQLEEDRGGVKKGKNILKESFKILVQDEKKEEAEE